MICPKKNILVGNSIASISGLAAIGKHNSLVIDSEVIRMIMTDEESNNIASIYEGGEQERKTYFSKNASTIWVLTSEQLVTWYLWPVVLYHYTSYNKPTEGDLTSQPTINSCGGMWKKAMAGTRPPCSFSSSSLRTLYQSTTSCSMQPNPLPIPSQPRFPESKNQRFMATLEAFVELYTGRT